jgi:predicted nucleic acid-binding protein
MAVSRIFWDTNLFIYLFEDHGKHSERTAILRQRMVERGDQLFTTVMTAGEVLVKPLHVGQHALAGQYQDAIQLSAVLLPFDLKAARLYAEIRAGQKISPPDAIQLACASIAGMDLFVTNDHRLQSLRIPNIHFITSVERAPI